MSDERKNYHVQATFSKAQWFALAQVAIEEQTPLTVVIRNAVTAFLLAREQGRETERRAR